MQPTPLPDLWRNLDSILEKLAVSGIWSHQQQVDFLESLVAGCDDPDMVKMAAERLAALRRMH